MPIISRHSTRNYLSSIIKYYTDPPEPGHIWPDETPQSNDQNNDRYTPKNKGKDQSGN